MPHLLLSWGPAGLVTVDLSDDRRVVLAFADPEQAARAGRAVAEQSGQEVEVIEVEAEGGDLAGAIEVLLGMVGHDGEVRVTFPGEALFEGIVAELEGGA
ncbi:hypothetical protein L6R53_01335 [Myxococcota bacterium]|nr:hypothetical protein [Myxococcota bacterium]